MKLFQILAFAAVMPFAALAQDTPAFAVGPHGADEIADLDQFLWLRRPLVVFADNPNDPNFRRQMQNIEADLASLAERDVVVITDTDPDAHSAVRQRLRPRGFSLVIMDKDGEVKRRAPAAWTIREVVHAIDRFPLRRDEMLERNPAGR
ncbi:MAG: DUF4174 domain-containing protein [Rhodobacterales bacterium]|nr:DUF4174 domain-containing protein [Rhodobacterales bacterium]